MFFSFVLNLISDENLLKLKEFNTDVTPTLLSLERSILHPSCTVYGMSEKIFFARFALKGIEGLTYLHILLKFKKKFSGIGGLMYFSLIDFESDVYR